MKTNNNGLCIRFNRYDIRRKTEEKHVTNHNQSHVAESSWHQNWKCLNIAPINTFLVYVYIYIPACSVMQSPHEYLVFFFVFVTVMNLVIFLSLSSIFILYVDVFMIALIAHNNTTISVKKRAFNNRFSNCWMREGLQKKYQEKEKIFLFLF